MVGVCNHVERVVTTDVVGSGVGCCCYYYMYDSPMALSPSKGWPISSCIEGMLQCKLTSMYFKPQSVSLGTTIKHVLGHFR